MNNQLNRFRTRAFFSRASSLEEEKAISEPIITNETDLSKANIENIENFKKPEKPMVHPQKNEKTIEKLAEKLENGISEKTSIAPESKEHLEINLFFRDNIDEKKKESSEKVEKKDQLEKDLKTMNNSVELSRKLVLNGSMEEEELSIEKNNNIAELLSEYPGPSGRIEEEELPLPKDNHLKKISQNTTLFLDIPNALNKKSPKIEEEPSIKFLKDSVKQDELASKKINKEKITTKLQGTERENEFWINFIECYLKIWKEKEKEEILGPQKEKSQGFLGREGLSLGSNAAIAHKNTIITKPEERKN
jgi:hypothetical protein